MLAIPKIEGHEKLLRESGGTTMGQEGYGMACNATEENDDLSLAESIVKYAERATMVERSVADLEGRLAVLEMGNTMAPPPQAAYFLPQQPTFMFPQQPPPTQIHIPQQQGWGPAAGGKRHTEGNAYRGKKPRQTGRGGRGGNGDNAHLVEGASMKAQHKTLPDGTGMGQGWILERNLGKAQFTMQKREEWKNQQHGGPAKWTSSWTSPTRGLNSPPITSGEHQHRATSEPCV
eukprot:scaffold2496_cov65-Attheya_sp.AAC.1